ncbi:hypothetical protein ACJKIH_03000 [Brucella pseudogrignonensis]|uniref:hypothetical protein n=1 Tax=Brucella pseudogrignonensis TaxID=419475 RepID=UPI0038B49A54
MDPKLTMNEEQAKQFQSSARAGGTVRLAGSAAWGATMFGPKPFFAPEGDAPSAPAAPAPAPSSEAPAEPPARAAPNAEPEKPVRPDYLPESLWDENTGFKEQDYNDLVAFKADRDAALAQVPDSADKYEAKLPATFKIPEGVKEEDFAFDANDPRISLLREVAHSKQWSQADFEEVLAAGINMDIAQNKEMAEAAAGEREKLGSRAKDRVTAVTTFLDAKIGKDLAGSLRGMMFTAKQVEAFEAIQRLVRGDVPGNPGAGRDAKPAELSDEEYQKLSSTDRINYARGIMPRSR